MIFMFSRVLIILCLIMSSSYAKNNDIQKQLDIQNEIIEIQSKRIDQLEIIIKELKNNIPSRVNSNNSHSDQTEEKQEEIVTEKSEDVISSSKNKIYNPETAFFWSFTSVKVS